MPTYVYSDGKHTTEIFLTFAQAEGLPTMKCTLCNQPMHRVPQVVPVNWNGLPPHLEGTRGPVAQQLIDGAPERRARYLDSERKKDG